MRRFILCFMALLLSAAGAIAFDGRAGNDSLAVTVEKDHPRLLLKAGEEKAVLDAVRSHPAVEKMHRTVMEWADAAMDEAPVTREMIGKRLLQTCRKSLKRVFALSYAYRMTDDIRYARRAEQEMLASCAFTDWNPSHFLDVGEMTMSMAIGYDWLYDVLSEQTKETVRQSVIEKAFGPLDNRKTAWFYNATSNWNSVCNAGLVYGAIAIYEHDPRLCSRIISRSVKSNPKVMRAYAPDGGYPEGYMYWGYGSSFEIMLIAALESACGTDFGLSEYPGFLQSGRFQQAMLTPQGGCYNFSDAWYGTSCNMMLFWMSLKTGDPSLLYTELEYMASREHPGFVEDRLLPFAIICASRADMDNVVPPDWHFWYSRGETPVFTYRSGWESADDTYFGIKGGSPTSSHSHLDGGSFIYETDGVRWALDLGMQQYYSLEKFGLDIWNTTRSGDRWKVFRYVNMHHNTISILDSLHNVSGRSDIVETFTSAAKKGAVVDMTSLFPSFRKVTRTATLDRRDDLHIEDVIQTGDASRTVVWMMNTEAGPEVVSEDEIRLVKEDHRMSVKFSATSPFRLEIYSNEPDTEYDEPNDGTVRIGLVMEVLAGRTEKIKADFSVSH